ncbi:hypothetical protein C8R44DRAFT_625973 [Mycena epipterygia]|nr:hypothetical protein C8R44DRAFT_625973 [Mycena epipterygia]
MVGLHITSNSQHALGKISFTMDVWSSKALQPYLAVTAHWLGLRAGTSQPALHQARLAFRHPWCPQWPAHGTHYFQHS